MGKNQGTKKAQARMAGKQSKTTQLPTTWWHCHKSPTTLEQNQAMAKETATTIPPPQ